MFSIDIRCRFDSVWKYALVGGLGSIPLTVALTTGINSNLDQSFNGLFLGAVLAGYLATNASRQAGKAGLLAGIIGGIPVAGWDIGWLLGISDGTVQVWSNPLPEVEFLILATITLIAFSMVVGAFGGVVGGWLSKKIHPQRIRGVGS